VGEYDYVALTDSGGDEGLGEACRLWWLMEGVVVTPSGTASWTIPEGYGYSGDLFAINRCHDGFNSYTGVLELWMRTLTPVYELNGSQNTTEIYIAYAGGEWRMYYRLFYLCVEGSSVWQAIPNSLYKFIISNPEGQFPGTPITTGSSDLWGYSLEWTAIATNQEETTPFVYSVANVGLTFSSERFYTLV
jgi:hypothetical protein